MEEIRREGVDEIVVGGDVVPGPMPAESLTTLLESASPVRFLRGNGENDVLALSRGEMPARIPEAVHDAMHWVVEKLHPGHLAELADWPATVDLEIPGLGEVLFCHATPRDDNELFTRRTPEDRLRPVFEGLGASVVICGHTHMQFDRPAGDVRVVNAGSVGLPFGEPGAFWALLGPGIELRSTPYDLAAAADRIRSTGYPGVTTFDVRNPPTEEEMLEVFEAAALR